MSASTPLPTMLSFSTGFDFSFHQAAFVLKDAGVVCCSTSTGEGSGVHGGLGLNIPISSWMYLYTRLGLEGHGSLFSTDKAQDSIPTPVVNQKVGVTLQRFSDVSMASMNLDLMLQPVLSRRPFIYLCAGASMSVPLQNSFFSYEQIIEPLSVNYTNGTQSRDFEQGSVSGLRKLQLGIRGGIGTIIRLRTLNVLVEALAHHNLMALTSDAAVNWRYNAVYINLGLVKSW